MIIGHFASKDEHIYVVQLTTYGAPDHITINIDNSNIIRFSDDPCHIITESEPGDAMIMSRAVVKFLCQDTTIYDDIVRMQALAPVWMLIGRQRPGQTAERLFLGEVKLDSFNQDYALKWTDIEINAYDYISQLEDKKYKNWSDWREQIKTISNVTIKDVINNIFNDLPLFMSPRIFYDNSITVGNNGSIMDCTISEHLFYGEEESDYMTSQEILEEVLKYFNLTIRQIGTDLYIYSAPLTGSHTFTSINMTPVQTTTLNISNITVAEDDYKRNDTQLTYDKEKTNFAINVELDMIDQLFEDVLSDDTVTSPYNYNSLLYRLRTKNGDNWNYYDIVAKMEIPSGMTLRYYNPQDTNVYTVDNLVEYDANNFPINGFAPFYKIKWAPMSPIMYTIGSIATREQESYYYDGRSSSMDRILSINYNLPPGEVSQAVIPNVYQRVIDTINRVYSEGGILEINDIDISKLAPNNAGVVNYITFGGTVSLWPQMPFTAWANETSQYGTYNLGRALVHNNEVVDLVGGTAVINPMYQGTVNYWYANFGQTSPANNLTEIYRFYNNTYPSTSNYIDTTSSPQRLIPVSFNWNGQQYSSMTGIGYYGEMDEEEAANIAMMLQISAYANPTYSLEDSAVANVRNHYNFTLKKLPILICEMKVGEKYCVEVPDPTNPGFTKFVWMTAAEATAQGITNKTFTLGIYPKEGDQILGKEFSFYSNKIDGYINQDGEAIPVRMSDNLSGNVEFRIIQPFLWTYPWWTLDPGGGGEVDVVDNTLYNPYAPDCYTKGCWILSKNVIGGMNQNIAFMIDQMNITNFECNIISDNPEIDEEQSETSIVYSNNNTRGDQEEYDFKFCSGFTNEELYKYNLNSGPAWNYIYTNNSPILSISNPSYTNIKPEKLFINRMYDIFNKGTKSVELTMDLADDMNHTYTFNWDSNHTYHPTSNDFDLKLDINKINMYTSL